MTVVRRIAPLALVVLWSSGFVGATLSARSAPAETTLLWRYVAAALPLVIVALAMGRRYSPSFVARETLLGLLGQVGYLYGVFVAADLGLSAGTSALVASLQPALVAVSMAALGERGGLRQAAGLAVGLAGVVVVVGGAADVSTLLGTGAAALGMLSLATATVVSHRWPDRGRHDVLDSLAVQSVVCVVAFGVAAVVRGRAVPPADGDFWVAVAWLVVLSFLGGYGAYLLVLRTRGPVTASAWLYLTPGTAALWSWAMFGDPLGTWTVLGLALAATGVAFIVPPRGSVCPQGSGPRPPTVDLRTGQAWAGSCSPPTGRRARTAALPPTSGVRRPSLPGSCRRYPDPCFPRRRW